MEEFSFIKNFPIEKIELAKAYIELTYRYEIDAEELLENFTEREVEFLTIEIGINEKNIPELVDKISRIEKQKEKVKTNSINEILPIEEFGPFAPDVEKTLRNSCIDTMEDLLNINYNKLHATKTTREHLEFMKKYYNFEKLENNNKVLRKENI